MPGSLHDLLSSLGEEVLDAEEESFLLFSRDIPSSNLGFCDSRASTIDLTIHDCDYTIHQSPSLLSSKREGGTTGAVLWKITPLFAEWISSTGTNPLWKSSILSPSATVIELGCGIAGLVALTLGPFVRKYIATDQVYVRKLFMQNIDENVHSASASSSKSRHHSPSSRKRSGKGGGEGARIKSNSNSNERANLLSPSRGPTTSNNNIKFVPLDWELDVPSEDTLLSGDGDDNDNANDDYENACNNKSNNNNTNNNRTANATNQRTRKTHGFDLLISCDSIYNESLIPPFVSTCADICKLRSMALLRSPEDGNIDGDDNDEYSAANISQERNKAGREGNPTIAIIAQQQRAPDVFETWLRESLRYFRVWRLDDHLLAIKDGKGLGEGSGYVVHALVLRSDLYL